MAITPEIINPEALEEELDLQAVLNKGVAELGKRRKDTEIRREIPPAPGPIHSIER